jgi:carbamoyltransferase
MPVQAMEVELPVRPRNLAGVAKPIHILGVSAFYHDAAACLLLDGRIIAAANEERFSRVKHDDRFPRHAVAYVLREGGIGIENVDYVGFYDKPWVKLERLVTTYLATFPKSWPQFHQAIPVWLNEKFFIRRAIRRALGYEGDILFGEHHLSHAASAFYCSPYRRAAILTIDGVGEWATAARGVGVDNRIELLDELPFPHSLGLLYSAFTYYLGFRVNSAEYKVMGLAPYGDPAKYYQTIRDELIEIAPDGSFRLNMDYFAYDYGLTMTNGRFERLFNGPARRPESPLTQREKDIAAALQQVTEELMVAMAVALRQRTGERYLCLAGGVALNCVGNGRVLREAGYEDIWIQPAAGDAGGAVGVAQHIWHALLGRPRGPAGGGTGSSASDGLGLHDVFLGPEFGESEIEEMLRSFGAVYRRYPWEDFLDRVAALIDAQNVVGWFQGRMEFGPRALGNRSILADARNRENWKRVNLKIKFRESFRPFAPTIAQERVSEFFELDRPSPYMLLVAQSRNGSIPATTHVDGSARIQTVSRDQNPLYYDLLKAFERRTDCPVLINTSFNVRGEPIVCSPADAYRGFMRTEMDWLAIGPFLLQKAEQPAWREDVDWRDLYKLD